MTIRVQAGNLLDAAELGKVNYAMHGCNCFHAMGSGIAGEIRRRYAEQATSPDYKTTRGDPSKLTTFSKGFITKRYGEAAASVGETSVPVKSFELINLYTQFHPGADFLPSLFPVAIQRVNKEYSGKRIGIPLIGCGIGGGDWETVQRVLLSEGREISWEVYVL